MNSLKDIKYKIHKIETLGLTRDRDVKILLEQAAKDAMPTMRKRQWEVPLLKEFLPENQSLLGLNVGGGSTIFVRVRKTVEDWYSYEHILGTLLHELVHIVHGPHNAEFHKLLDEITKECEININTKVVIDPGYKLSCLHHNPLMYEAKLKAVEAAEKRYTMQKLMGPKILKLGGIKTELTPREAAAQAAQKRQNS